MIFSAWVSSSQARGVLQDRWWPTLLRSSRPGTGSLPSRARRWGGQWRGSSWNSLREWCAVCAAMRFGHRLSRGYRRWFGHRETNAGEVGNVVGREVLWHGVEIAAFDQRWVSSLDLRYQVLAHVFSLSVPTKRLVSRDQPVNCTWVVELFLFF